MYRERPLFRNSRLTDRKNKRHDALFEMSVSFGTDKDEIGKKIRYPVKSSRSRSFCHLADRHS